MPAQLHDQPTCELAVGSTCPSVGDEVDTQKQAAAADVADGEMVVRKGAEASREVLAHVTGVLTEVLLLHHVEHSESRRAGHGRASEGAEELHAVVERLGDLRRGHYSPERESVTIRFRVDGKLKPENLEKLGYSELELERVLKATGVKHIKSVFLATSDETGSVFIQDYQGKQLKGRMKNG
mgnify:CR=1 FL=1